jgi:hypothetical protein
MWVIFCYVILAVGVIWSARRVAMAPRQLLQRERVHGAGPLTDGGNDHGDGDDEGDRDEGGSEYLSVTEGTEKRAVVWTPKEQEEWEAWQKEWAEMRQESRGRTLSRA